jgi:hypothetical protein
MTFEAEPVAGIGSPAVAASAEAPPLSYEDREARRIAANTPPPGTSIVGPYAGKKGLSFGDDNTFDIYDEQEVRVVDGKGNVIFSGIGVEGAKRAVAVAQSLSDDLGKNANFRIQKAENTIVDGRAGPNRYIDVAYAAPSQSGLGFLADTVLPFAASFIPVIGPVAGAALGSALSSGLQGRSLQDALVRAAIAGGTAGAVKVSGLDTAIGGALSTAAPQAAGQVAGQVAGQAVGGAGDIVVSGLTKALQSAGGALGSAALTQAANAGLSDVTGYQKPAERFVEQPLPEALQPPVQPPVEDAIVVSGIRTPPAADAVTGAISGIGSGIVPVEIPPSTVAPETRVEELPPVEEEPVVVVTGARPDAVADAVAGIGGSVVADAIGGFETPAEKFVEEPLPEELKSETELPAEDTIVVTGTRATPVADAVTSAISGIGNAAATDVINQPAATEQSKTAEEIEEEKTGDIVSLGKKTPSVNVPIPGIGTPGVVDPVTGDIVVSKPKPEPEIVTKEPDLPVGSVLATLPITGLPTPDPALTDPKSTLEKVKDAVDIATTVLPIVGGIAGGGGGGDSGPLVPSGGTYDVNPNRSDVFGTRGLATIKFDPFTYGQATGNQPGEFMFFTRNPVTGQELLQSAPAPITTPVANEPAGPAGYVPPSNVFAEGGEVDDDMAAHLMAYHKNGGHTGPGQVKGIGSGQEDKIPAWLSDGEYVWSAQDVADLGDGSTDEGVRRLDKMRHMVRRRAGRKDVKKIAKPQKGIDHMLKAVGGSV